MSDKKYYVYIVKCSDETFYTGITTDVSRRIDEHNGEIKDASGKEKKLGAKYTNARRPVELVYTAQFPDRSSASKEEARIKKMTRGGKMELIDNKNP